MEHADSLALPTVRDIIALAEIQHGAPEVIAPHPEGLENPIRWAHVVAGASAASLLDGGELALTTGAGWPSSGPELVKLVETLCDVGISALALELGANFDTTPPELSTTLERHGIPLIVLHKETRFVQITQRIHRLILGAQYEALQARDEVHRLFTKLGLNRSPADFMVEQMAVTLQAPVILENTAGEVIAWSTPEKTAHLAELLEPWMRGSFVHPGTAPPEGFEAITRVPVEAQGTRFGTLTALPGPPHPAGRFAALELGAIAIALGRLADDSGDPWVRLSSKQLFNVLLGGRYRTERDLEAQLVSAGLPFENRVLFGLSLTGVGPFGSHSSLEHAVLETALRRTVAPEGRIIVSDDPDIPQHSLLALASLPQADTRITNFESRLARELNMLVPTTTPDTWYAHLSLGTKTSTLRGLIASIEQVRRTGLLDTPDRVGKVRVQEAVREPLPYLIREFHGDPALQEYVTHVLGPLIEHDQGSGPGHTGDLLTVLGAYLAHPTNRSLAAQKSGLSRSVFYGRLDVIETLLDVDLSDGHTIAALQVALIAHRIHSS